METNKEVECKTERPGEETRRKEELASSSGKGTQAAMRMPLAGGLEVW